MRVSTILSFLVAVALAGLAAFGARDLLIAERAELLALNSTQEVQAPVVEEAPKITIVVADEPLRFGERLTPDRLREIEWASDVTPAGSFRTIEDMIADETDESARFVVSAMEVGEPVLATKITTPGARAKLSTALTPGMKAMSIPVNDVLGVAGFVLPGDRVDVMLTRSGGNVAGGTFVDVLLQGVKVLAIDQITDEMKDNPSVVRTVTFEVNTLEAQKLVLASNVGTLSLALRNVASSDVEEIQRVTSADLGIPDVADDLVREPTAEELAEQARIAALEETLKGLTEGFAQRFDQVEALISDSNTEVEQTPVQTVQQRVSSRITVGVVRNGQRSEYNVGVTEDE